jgi:DNA-binding HxlR family transcriptional regulator
MQSYNQFCPIAKAAEVFCQKWTPLILRDLAFGASRFSELQRGVPLASPSLLSQRLKELIANGVVEKRRAESGRGSMYHLTDAGREFVPMIMALGEWGRHWSPRFLPDNEADLGTLLWALEGHVNPKAFAQERTIVEVEFTDQPKNKRSWWFVNSGGECQLCLEKPDRTSDLYITTSLKDMIHIWRGDVSLAKAIDDGRLEAHGPTDLLKALPDWLETSPFSKIPSALPTEETRES